VRGGGGDAPFQLAEHSELVVVEKKMSSNTDQKNSKPKWENKQSVALVGRL
jgi:hypothetical protein